MYRGQDFVGQSSDGVTNTSNGSNSADLAASVWTAMQQDSQARTSGASSSSSSEITDPRAARATQDHSIQAPPNTMAHESDATTQTRPNEGTDQSAPNTQTRPNGPGQTRPNEGPANQQSPPDSDTPGDTRPSGPGIPSGPEEESPSSLTSRRLYERFQEQDRLIGNELYNSPTQRILTPQYHELAQQRIRDADNLPHERLRREAEQGNQRALDLQNRITRTNESLLQSSSQSPELRQLIPDLLQNIDSARWEHLSGNQEGMARLRQIAPHVADTLETRRELGQRQQEINETDLWETNRLIDMPMRARFEYAQALVETGGGEEQKAVRFLTEMLNARPESLNYAVRGHYGQISFGDLAVRSGALHAKGFLAALGRAGGSSDRILREYHHRFPPELNGRNR